MPRVVHEAAVDVPREYFAAYRNLHNLVFLKQEVYYDHRARTPDYRAIYQQTIWYIETYPYEKLLCAMELKNGPLMLELCMRRLAECEVPLDLTLHDVMEILESLVGVDFPWMKVAGRTRKILNIQHQSPLLQQRAVAACAWMHFDAYFKLPYGDSLYSIAKTDVMQKAAFCANTCVSLRRDRRGLQPPIVIRMATWLVSIWARYDVDVQELETFCRLKDFWTAWSEYGKREHAKDLRRFYKRQSSVNDVYVCAAEGCRVRAAHKSSFRACGGTCAPEIKPHYCSQQCQAAHWYAHRSDCQSDTHSKNKPPVDGDRSHWDNLCWLGYLEHAPDDLLAAAEVWAPQPGAEIFVDIRHPSPYRPGEWIRIRTRTLSPAFLRYCVWYFDEELHRSTREEAPRWARGQNVERTWSLRFKSRPVGGWGKAQVDLTHRMLNLRQ